MPNIQNPGLPPVTPPASSAATPAAPAVPEAAAQAPEATAPAPAAKDGLTLTSKAERSPLQRHVDFFDRDGDHKITVGESYSGLRALGLGAVTSGLGAAFINAGLASKTGAKWPSPLTINTDNIASAKHDSDSDVYDAKGQLDQAKFEEMFASFDTDKDDKMSAEEFTAMRTHKKESTAGSIGSKAEFGLLVKLAGEAETIDGKDTRVISKDRMKQFYNGSLFYKMAGEKVPFKTED